MRGKSDWQPELLLLDFLLPHQDLSLLQARFLLVHAALLFLPLKKTDALRDAPPPGGTIDLSKPSSNAQALKSTKSFSSEVLVTLEVPCPVWLWCLLEGPATIVSLSCVQDLPRRLAAFLTQTGLILLPS